MITDLWFRTRYRWTALWVAYIGYCWVVLEVVGR
jgi:hypothetical protein